MQEIIIDEYKLNKTLNEGGVISFVTDTVWGLGCLPENEKAVNKIYEIKGRDRNKPLILMSDKTENLMPYVKNISKTADTLIKTYFPGALTVILEKSELTPDFISSGRNTIGIRLPDNEFFRVLCAEIHGHVLATTSANLTNSPSSKSYEEALNSIGAYTDIVFEDFGYKCGGLESTVVLAADDNIKILRHGSLSIQSIVNLK